MKTAIVHDWLVTFAGSERVVYELAQMYPDAPIYTTVYDENAVGQHFDKSRVKTSFLQRIPGAVKHYQKLLPLMPMAFEQFDLSEYDLILSSSHACAKGIIQKPGTVHICYCHTPIRYVWSHYQEYLASIKNRFQRIAAARLLHKLRIWDYAAAQRVDHFIANSNEVKMRIQKYYGKDAAVMHPPIHFNPQHVSWKLDDVRSIGTDHQEAYYLCLGRLVSYKRVDLAVRACSALNKPLIVAGTGPELSDLKAIAGPSVTFLGEVTEQQKQALLHDAKALLFCGEEDFGIVPVEATLAGTPVIGYGKGGLLDTVERGKNGWFFYHQQEDSLREAILDFEQRVFNREEIQEIARNRFNPAAFRHNWNSFLNSIDILGERRGQIV